MNKTIHTIRLILLLYLLLAGCAKPLVVSGDLQGEQVWSGQVRVEGDVVLAEGSHLRILPGTNVVFYPAGQYERFREHPHFPGSELIVHGTIIAEGTADRPINFSYVDKSAPAGSWGGINIMESLDSSFEYAIFRQADSAIHSQDSRLYIEQSIFENNKVAIRFHTSEILIENNLIRKNGAGIRFHFGQPVICKNDIVQNEKGIFITSHPRNYIIENNTIMANDRNIVLGEEVPEDVALLRNYWGESDVWSVRKTFFDGQYESYLGHVKIQPIRTEPDPASGPNWNR